MQYTHKINKRAKRLIMRIDDGGGLVITTPPRVSNRTIEKFIHANGAWISKHKKVATTQKAKSVPNSVNVFGKTYTKQVISHSTKTGVFLNKSIIELHRLENTTKSDAEAIQSFFTDSNPQLLRFLKNTAEKYIVPRTHQVGKHMDISFGKITLREQKTRWGSCSSTGTLNFNWRLIHHPSHIIDYVIVHELAHRKHMDHSKAFWKLVETFDPSYRIHRGYLKRKGMAWK